MAVNPSFSGLDAGPVDKAMGFACDLVRRAPGHPDLGVENKPKKRVDIFGEITKPVKLETIVKRRQELQNARMRNAIKNRNSFTKLSAFERFRFPGTLKELTPFQAGAAGTALFLGAGGAACALNHLRNMRREKRREARDSEWRAQAAMQGYNNALASHANQEQANG